MPDKINPKPYELAADEKSVMVMVYYTTGLYWGEVVVKETNRVSTWLRTSSSPEIITLYNAKGLITTTPVDVPKPMLFSELHVPASLIQAFHMIPPAQDPPDYDPTEPNRYMHPTTVLIGTFRFDGHTRLSTRTSLAKYLDITREKYSSLYDVEIRCPAMPALGVMKVPFVLLRQSTAVFCQRN